MAGEDQQGTPGCTFVDDDAGKAYYVKLEHLVPVVFRDKFSKTVENDDNKHYFIVHKHQGYYHVTSYSREDAEKVDWKRFQENVLKESKSLESLEEGAVVK
jgi:hypothetical protein